MANLTKQEWAQLSDLILSARHEKKLIRFKLNGYDEILHLVKAYLNNNNDHESIDRAAELVANLKPGATAEGKATPWVLLEKS